MRGGTVAGAVLLMILGFVFVSMFPVQSVGGVQGMFSPQIIGILLMVLGFVLFIAGLAASPKEEKQPPQPIVINQSPPAYLPQQPPIAEQKVLAICPKCKKRIASESKFCPECGFDLQEPVKT